LTGLSDVDDDDIATNHTVFLYLFAVSSTRNGSNYNVRVYNRKTAERALLKGFNGRVVDISFAFASSIVLGIVDEVGGLFVYDIAETAEGKITYPFYTVVISWMSLLSPSVLADIFLLNLGLANVYVNIFFI